MKNRKRIVVAFLICAVMLLGVGFAAITGELTITGNAANGVQNFNVMFINAELTNLTDSEVDGVVPTVKVENTTLATGSDFSDNSGRKAVSLTVSGLATTEDVATVTFTIKNFNKVAMELTPTISSTTKFDVTGGFLDGDDEGSELDATTVVEAEGETTYTVTVKLKSDNYDESINESFTIILSGESVTN